VPEYVVCELVHEYNIPAELQGYRRSAEDTLDIREIDFGKLTDEASPHLVAEILKPMVVPEDLLDQIKPTHRDGLLHYRWRSDQHVRYQMWIDGIACPDSYAEFTVWIHKHPGVSSKFANVTARLYRVVSKGELKHLLPARQAFADSGLWNEMPRVGYDERKPITSVRRQYMPNVWRPHRPGQRILFRPVWYFSSDSWLLGDLFLSEDYRIDAVTGQEFRMSARN